MKTGLKLKNAGIPPLRMQLTSGTGVTLSLGQDSKGVISDGSLSFTITGARNISTGGGGKGLGAFLS